MAMLTARPTPTVMSEAVYLDRWGQSGESVVTL